MSASPESLGILLPVMSAAQSLKWAGPVKRTEALAEGAGLQVFLTVDRGIEYQQSLRSSQRIAVVVVRSKSNRLADLIVYVSDFLQALKSIEPGQFMRISLIK
jgi:hypothetical protein